MPEPANEPVGALAGTAGDHAEHNGHGEVLDGEPDGVPVARETERRDGLPFELGRARGRTEVLEGELRRLGRRVGRVR